MSTRSCIIIKVRKEDIGKELVFDSEKVPVTQRKWSDDNPIMSEKDVPDMCKPILIEKPYIAIYCHWDGYIEGVGKSLKLNFTNYEQALNLVLGGWCSVVDDDHILRYAVRAGEKWDVIKPLQFDTAEDAVNEFEGSWAEYAYLYLNNEHDWVVKEIIEKSGFKDYDVDED